MNILTKRPDQPRQLVAAEKNPIRESHFRQAVYLAQHLGADQSAAGKGVLTAGTIAPFEP